MRVITTLGELAMLAYRRITTRLFLLLQSIAFFKVSTYWKPGLWIRIRIGSGFSDFVDPDPYWESGSRIRIQGQES
jgi:hypothetical protein